MNAEESILLTLQLLDGRMVTLILPTIEFLHYFEDTVNKISEMIIPIEIKTNEIKEGDMMTGLYLDVTNDPTPHRAGGVVSLGYYTLRISYKFCTIKSLSPLTLIGYGGDIETNIIESSFTRPLRRVTP